jgi:RNA recognition motif-containing protein
MKIYVGNLPFDCDSAQLTDLFGRYGEVMSAQIITDRDSGRSRGFGFVEMGDEQARAAIAGLEGTDLGGRNLTVNEAKPRTDRGGRPSSGNRPERSRW